MSGAAPWSVKGIDPKAREVAKDLARRSGMTLGEWLNTMIMEGDEDEVVPLPRRLHAAEAVDRRSRSRRLDDVYAREDDALDRAFEAVETLTARIEAVERRSTLAIGGVDQAVGGLVRRLDASDQDRAQLGRRLDEIAEDLKEGHRRLRRFEQETGPRQAEVMAKFEDALGKLASRFFEAEARGRDGLVQLRDRFDRFEREGVPERVSERVTEQVVARVAQRLEAAQARTAEALARLDGSFGQLDQRLREAEARGAGPAAHEVRAEFGRFEKLAETLARQVEDARAEMLHRFDTAAQDGRIERMERAFAGMASQAKEAERDQARAVEAIGRDVLRIAQNLDGRLAKTESGQQAARVEALKAVETMGQEITKRLGGDMARVADALEQRLRRGEDTHAAALERLTGELSRVSERLGERIAQSERRAAQSVEEITERLNRASEKMESRYDRASGELVERMRQSEERTARLLAEARETLDKRLARPADPVAAWQPEAFPASTFAQGWDEPATDPFPTAAVPEGPAPSAFAPPVFEPQEPAAQDAEGPAWASLDPAPGLGGADPLRGLDDGYGLDSADLDSFDDQTEFVASQDGRPLSTRQAIEAARAATRDGEAKSQGTFGFRLGGNRSRLKDRVDRQARREPSTLKKTLTASVTAALVIGAGTAGVLGYQRLAAEGTRIPGLDVAPTDAGGPALAAAATVPTSSPAAPEEAQALYDQAVLALAEGREDAVELLTRAANLGWAPAQFRLAQLYAEGEAGLVADPVEARAWTERAARGGEPGAMNNLALYLFDGVGGARDQAEAARWFRAAAERGQVDSQYNLARLYEQGLAVERSAEAAYRWYLIAAEGGDADAAAAAERLRAELPSRERLSAEAEASAFSPSQG